MSDSVTINGSNLVCVYPAMPDTPGALIGVSREQMLGWRTVTQNALQMLMTGQAIVTVQYGEGQGHRMVTYRTANIAGLQGWLATLNKGLGIRTRRAIGVWF